MVASAKGETAGTLAELVHANLFAGGVVDVELALRDIYIAGHIRHHARDKRRYAEAFESGRRDAVGRVVFLAGSQTLSADVDHIPL
jgi:hypothetical protein